MSGDEWVGGKRQTDSMRSRVVKQAKKTRNNIHKTAYTTCLFRTIVFNLALYLFVKPVLEQAHRVKVLHHQVGIPFLQTGRRQGSSSGVIREKVSDALSSNEANMHIAL
jgi:hypothetical protein